MAAQIKRNDKYEACLKNGRLDVYKLSHSGGGEDAKVVKERCSNHQLAEREQQGLGAITCLELTSDFLIFGTEEGGLVYNYLDEAAGPCLATEYSHENGGITRLWPNNSGTRLLFEDDHHLIYLHNPVSDQTVCVPQNTGEVDIVLWDIGDSFLFVLLELCQISIYIYSPVNIQGSKVSFVQTATIPAGLYPVSLQNSMLVCKQDNGALDTVTVPTHTWLKKSAHGTKQLRERFDQYLTVHYFKEALQDAKSLNCTMVWEELIKKALEQLELDVAMKACQYSGNIKLLMSLRNLQHFEEYNLLAGHIFLLLENFDAAQESFLKSTCPEAAVEMRRDLEHWNQAMALARDLKSPLEAEILTKYAHSLELAGDYRQALLSYEEFLKLNLEDPKQKYFCQAGVARTSIHLGDIWKGKQLAKECKNSLLYRECARLLEGLSLQQDAAEMYELDGQLEKAVDIYITTKNYAKALRLLETIASPKFYMAYAKALEMENFFAEASSAYEAAKEYGNAVKLYLGPLNNPSEAFAVVRKTRSLEGAGLVCRYCRNIGDYRNAIEFLILQKRTQEASELAQQQDMMDIYTEMVADIASKEECLKLARYYEAIGNSEKAGQMFEKCDDPKQALRLYLSQGIGPGIEQAIDLVDRERNDELTNQLLGFLKGGTEGVDKSPKYLFRLYMVFGDYILATKAALEMAQEEQEMGNYKIAHQQLLDLCKVLQSKQRLVPHEVLKQLILLHSYTLVKTLIRLGDHKSSARMLIRVAQHISKFPSHVIPILISTVIECQRSGLKKTAFEFASMLMRPEYRNQITGPYKRKVENIVRKPEREEEDEEFSACPFCQQLLPETQLECPTCKNDLPFCIASGRHMVLGNWTKCPSCQFPALTTEFIKIIEIEGTCPMCWSEVAVKDVKEISDPIGDMKVKETSSTPC
ncbi:unnamed protein product [Calypogeia fissa]